MERQASEALKQKMCVRYAQFFELSEAETWEDLPGAIQGLFRAMEYKQIVHPLLWWDMNSREYSVRRVARFYHLPRMTACRLGNAIPEDLGYVITELLRAGACC